VDDVQQYPDLFSYVQVVVDENPESHIVLIGSSNFALLQRVTQSLAGRTAVLTLLPLSLSELGKERLTASTDTIMLNGGYPSVWAENIPVQTVSKNYYNTYIERDLRQLINIKDLSKYQVFIRLCAGRTGTEFNASALSNEVGVSVPTIHEWLSTLEASYIVFRMPPFFRNVGKRLIKSPKIYFYDTGLLCFLLGIENENHLQTHPLRGAIFENMVVLEFLKNRFNAGKLSNLYFYRDKSQREIDIVQEFADTFKAYEIKSASAFHPDFMHNLNYLKDLLNEKLTSTQVIYDGEIELKSSKNGIVNFRNISF
jgi:predicted AAA+ superfamily ATPase